MICDVRGTDQFLSDWDQMLSGNTLTDASIGAKNTAIKPACQ